LTDKEKKEGRNPWAGKNPCSVTKIGTKGISGELWDVNGEKEDG
jgi:hypothetical protein